MANPGRFAQDFALALGQGVAEFIADSFGEGFELRDDGRMRGGDIGGLARIGLQVEKLGAVERAVLIFDWLALGAAGSTAERAVGAWEMEFPATVAGGDGLELIFS